MMHSTLLQFLCDSGWASLHIIHDLVLLQADKLEAAVIQQAKSTISQRTPDCSRDVRKKASLSESKSITSAKSTPQLITPNDNKVLLKIHYV